MSPYSIKKFLKDKKIDFYLITNNDLHLNESPNLDLKDIYELFKLDEEYSSIMFVVFFSTFEISFKNLDGNE